MSVSSPLCHRTKWSFSFAKMWLTPLEHRNINVHNITYVICIYIPDQNSVRSFSTHFSRFLMSTGRTFAPTKTYHYCHTCCCWFDFLQLVFQWWMRMFSFCLTVMTNWCFKTALNLWSTVKYIITVFDSCRQLYYNMSDSLKLFAGSLIVMRTWKRVRLS